MPSGALSSRVIRRPKRDPGLLPIGKARMNSIVAPSFLIRVTGQQGPRVNANSPGKQHRGPESNPLFY